MGIERLQRFHRTDAGLPPIKVTDRDSEIIRVVYHHRFLRSNHIFALLGGSRQGLLRRLQLLYHHGYLERPIAQLEFFHKGGSSPIVYGIGNKGARLLASTIGIKVRHFRWNEKNQAVRRLFLSHALAVSDILVALEVGARLQPEIKFISNGDLFEKTKRNLKWRVQLNRTRFGLRPDAAFCIESKTQGRARRSFFFLEVDRGTMPVIRKGLSQTSIFRKFLSYEATWKQGLHKKLFGIDRFRVLTISTIPGRVQSLIDACSKLKSGHRLFLFSDLPSFVSGTDIFHAPCFTGKQGEKSALLP